MTEDNLKFNNGFVDYKTRRPRVTCDLFSIEGNTKVGDGVDLVYYKQIVEFILTTSDEVFSETREVEFFRDVRSALLDLVLEIVGEEMDADEVNSILENEHVYEYFENYAERNLCTIICDQHLKEYQSIIDSIRVETQR